MSARKFLEVPALIGLAILTILLSACAAEPLQQVTASLPTPASTPQLQDTEIPEVVQATEKAPALPPSPSPTPLFTRPHPILGDLRVRQALALCTGRTGLGRAVYPWLEDPSLVEMDSFVPRDHWAYPQDGQGLVRYPYDPDQGKELLEEAGWIMAPGEAFRKNAAGQELALTLTTSTAEFRKAWTAVLAEQWQACGVRLKLDYREASWLFGEASGLARREFEIAAFSWQYFLDNDPGFRTIFACDQVPSPENGWQGQNFTGWCNPSADVAIRLAAGSLERETRHQAYQVVQVALSQDLPYLPLFQRLEINAANPAFQNFSPDIGEVYSWNAAQWSIPGKDTLVLGEASEPASLSWVESSYVGEVIRALVLGLEVTRLQGDYQPVTLTRLPTVENGGTQTNQFAVSDGAAVVDSRGRAAAMEPGLRVLDVQGNEVSYSGGSLHMNQLVTTFEYLEGLTWSDGTPVSQADYELGYRLACSPELRQTEAFQMSLPEPYLECDRIERVDFLSDTTYRVTWKPGFQGAEYFLPPVTRQPAHQQVEDGRRLAEVSPTEWANLPEVELYPLGIGPYTLQRWEFGRQMELKANPYYFQGPPATPNLVVRFVERDQILGQLTSGKLDVVGWDSFYPATAAESLIQTQPAGQVRVYPLPANIYEHIDFALFVP